MHPLEEAMLGCDVDGEGSGYWADGQEGPPLLPPGPGWSGCISFQPLLSLSMCLYPFCPGLLAGICWCPAPGPSGSLPAPPSGPAGDVSFCQPWRTLFATPAPQAPATSQSPGTAATSRGP